MIKQTTLAMSIVPLLVGSGFADQQPNDRSIEIGSSTMGISPQANDQGNLNTRTFTTILSSNPTLSSVGVTTRTRPPSTTPGTDNRQ